MKGLQQPLRTVFEDAKCYRYTELLLMKAMYQAFAPSYAVDAETINVFAVLQQYLHQLSTYRFITDKPVSLLMHIHQIMQYMYQFQIIDRHIPLQFVQKTLSILDIEQAVPILSVWTTNDPGIHPPKSKTTIQKNLEFKR